MKKLMIAAVAGMFAVAANAAAMNWSTGMDYTDPAGNVAGGEGYITMYLFSIDSATYADLTKGGEIIRSITYIQAMPLLIVAALYLAMVMFFSYLVTRLERRLRSSER